MGAAHNEDAAPVPEVLEDGLADEGEITMNDTGTTTRTVAEIEAELRAAREAEDKQRRAAEAEKQRQVKEAEIATTNNYMEELATKLTEAGVTCKVRPGTFDSYKRYAEIDIPEFEFRQDVKLDSRGGYTKGYQITVGSYGNRKVYPLLKSGTFKYDAIVEDIKQRIERIKAQSEYDAERKQKRQASEQIVKRLQEQFELSEYNTVLDPCDTDAEKVVLKLKMNLTEAQAKAILAAARATDIELR